MDECGGINLTVNEHFERSFVHNDDCRTPDLHELFLFEITKEMRDGFP